MRLFYLLCIPALVLLTGCSSLPACGTPEAKGKHCSLGYAPGAFVIPVASRDYVTNPVTLPAAPTTTQPSFGNAPSEQYQTILVNTPNGLVYKRCKVLNGQAVACF